MGGAAAAADAQHVPTAYPPPPHRLRPYRYNGRICSEGAPAPALQGALRPPRADKGKEAGGLTLGGLRRARRKKPDSVQLGSQIFNTTFNPTGLRTGNKILRQRLKGPALADYYLKRGPTIKDMRKLWPDMRFPDEEEDQRVIAVERCVGESARAPAGAVMCRRAEHRLTAAQNQGERQGRAQEGARQARAPGAEEEVDAGLERRGVRYGDGGRGAAGRVNIYTEQTKSGVRKR